MNTEVRDKFLEELALSFGQAQDYINNSLKDNEVYEFWFNILDENYTVHTGFTSGDTQFYIKLYIAKGKKEDIFKNDTERKKFLQSILDSNQNIFLAKENWKVNESTFKPYIERRFSVKSGSLPDITEIVDSLNKLKKACTISV